MVLVSVLVMSNLAAKTTKYKQLLMAVLPVNLVRNSKLSQGIHLEIKEMARVMVEVEEDVVMVMVVVIEVAVLNNMVVLRPPASTIHYLDHTLYRDI